MNEYFSGRCLCGTIEYEINGDPSPMVACHCKQCRQWGGHAWHAIGASIKNFSIVKGEDELKWYESSDFSRRGFCSNCGSSLFWHADRHEEYKNYISVAASTIDDLKGRKLTQHIFTEHKGDYYDITDELSKTDN